MKVKLFQWCLAALIGVLVLFAYSCQEEELITPLGDVLQSSSKVPINSEARFKILDSNFENALIELRIDDELDGYALKSNTKYVISLNVKSKNISDLSGIEYFKSLEILNCSNNSLTSLDVSKNKTLEYLDCFWNPLTSLDVSKNTALEYLGCWRNQLTSLDVSKNTALEVLFCDFNELTSLDVSKNTALTTLGCTDNELTSLDVSQNTALEWLYCPNNQLTSLDVNGATALKFLWCFNNQLISLDVSNNIDLRRLFCWENPNLQCIKVNSTQLASTVSYPWFWDKDSEADWSVNCQ